MKVLISVWAFFLATTLANAQKTDSWHNALSAGKGQINIFWFKSKPFIFINENGEIEGIEHSVMDGFKNYLKQVYKVDLEIKWTEAASFQKTYDHVKNSTVSNNLGASVFSITPERRREVGFAPPYMQDITVLISSYDVDIAKNANEFNQIFSDLTAITIQGTTYQADLQLLKKEKKIDFEIEFIPSSERILQTIEENERVFGFIDLPIYLTEFKKNPTIRVKRQNLYSVKREGYSIIYPLGSDWQIPLESYFFSVEFKKGIEAIKSRYLDQDVYQFIENQYAQTSQEDILLLTKEKEIQKESLLGKNEEIRRETELRYILIVALVIILLFVLVIFKLYWVRSNAAILLAEQKVQIENQKLELEKRNISLTRLNEEKNELIKILAHDLRTPITHIHAFAHLIKLDSGKEDQEMYVEKIIDATSRLSRMITKVLDVDSLESNRVNVKMENVNLAEILEKVIVGFEKEAIRKDISLNFLSTKKQIIVRSDLFYITQIYENLLSNAIKFTPFHKAVNVRLEEESQEVCVAIEDEGPGLTEEDKEHLFKKYKKLSAEPTGLESSTGLGLSIVKRYADILNIKIEYTSMIGQGTTFITRIRKSNGSVL